jgi:glycosyltransferase involved in cell wall biosynthesis
MRIVFVDGTFLDYTPATPFERPLGGMQSAACYLAIALARRGHAVSLINRGNTRRGSYHGVWCAGFDTISGEALNRFDVVVSISTGSRAYRLDGVTRPLVLWTGHDIDRAAVEALRDETERYLWDRIVMVSEWQADRYCAHFQIKRDQVSVLRNAVSPAFEGLQRAQPYFFESGRPPVLFYSSTPYRGLDVLLAAFPLIRARLPDCEARIYSGMEVYQTPAKEDPHRPLYERCRSTEGLRYIGSVSQSALAKAAAEVDVFAYPSTYAETSCIALMAAMSAGCLVLGSTLGALPETAAGFGSLCERPANASKEQFAELYARHAVGIIEDANRNPERYAAQLETQRSFALKNYSWSGRAIEWEALLADLLHRPVRTGMPRRNDPCPCGSGRKFKRCCGSFG